MEINVCSWKFEGVIIDRYQNNIFEWLVWVQGIQFNIRNKN